MSTLSVLELFVADQRLACEASHVRVSRGLAGPSLSRLLGRADSAGSLCIEVTAPSRRCVFSGVDRAFVRDLDERQFVRLPRILGELGCPAWMRGVAEFQEGLAIWVDLVALAEASLVEAPRE
ncbi:MAG: hypothetical protein HY791_29150 [Deltaproteobacteria bacterium]|nr:hypothetical protein [Deltaproteobacteria bacterium]